jgi:pimeloyl-ACP methyl ester carboxylesterase
VPRARSGSAPYGRGSARCRLAASLTKLLIVRDEHGYSSAELPLYYEWHGKSPSSGPLLLLMLTGFADWPDSLVASITAPTLVLAADRDVVRTEHAVLLASRIPNARLLIVPGNHGDYLGELVAAAGDPGPLRRALPFLVAFLDQPECTTQSGARPGWVCQLNGVTSSSVVTCVPR